MHRFPLLFVLLVYLSCMQYPAELNNQRIADCSHATIPKGYKPDSSDIYEVIEIYDYQQKLISFSETKFILTNPSGPSFSADIYWNGTDSDGKPVDPGKYLAKISILSIKDTSCSCAEVFISK